MEELPKAFVSSLRVLFEILDEDSDGFVELREIEKRWQGDSVSGLPAGVVESLRGIAPKDGRLSFERFCNGLKITLEKNRANSRGKQVQVRGSRNSRDDKQPTTATVRPNNVVHPMRARSAPQLQEVPENKNRQLRNSRSSASVSDDKRKSDPPDYASHMQKSKDKPRRPSEKGEDLYKSKPQGNAFEPSAADRKRVEATLKSWKQEKYNSERHFQQRPPDLISDRHHDQAIYAKSSLKNGDRLKQPIDSNYERPPRRASEGASRGGRRKKDEPRRHTLSNGIDYNMLKRMKQLEQERDTFLHGLEALELARDWYRQQLADIKERQDRLNKAQVDYSEDINHQDLVTYRTTRITEVNRQLRALIATPEKGFPNHMNLAINRERNGPKSAAVPPLLVDKLKQQNKLLTEEVSERSERIAELEQEKAALIRQLFEARGRQRDLPDNTTFL
ncbi:suppressor APC domain-containing protein 2-like [Diadema antillarum]|uniref:suppressor APC domain-containing protein 2-like n=1 Tax=Diadema antillarum TaxID=105358 RepID=UPI003A8556E8